ncbi:MAG: carbamoyl-phosphate synthase large subunit, partial [Candidatus Marinimicrobia bacterium]|nr:carbamoyl-phosphate synthase large subunit [Candidatus Neomarinimicrobiota bacterium]
MPKRTDIESILIIGAGPIIIGQACEFDYSGTQACKALREEGYRIILVNSNPATIMTDRQLADATYLEPVTPEALAAIIEKERPDALLPTVGGQTALDTAMALHENGVLEKYNVELIGANVDAIQEAEDREKFKVAMEAIGIETARGGFAKSLVSADKVIQDIPFPVIIRPSFTMGGTGGSVAYNGEEYHQLVEIGLSASPIGEVLIEESLLGWKEYEMEVIRDSADNAIIICSIENIDPMGVHTGDSITVAPAQTLTDKEYQKMRNWSIQCLRKIGVDTGGSNVQFTVNPETGRTIIIEMNPRVSRSSALASKATGFPIAKIAAKLAVGYTLDELPNDITGQTLAAFEPSIDYVVTKIPRFDFEKFPSASGILGVQMQSVGEVMAIGRTFRESVQKAFRSLEVGLDGFEPKETEYRDLDLSKIRFASAFRLLKVKQALEAGHSIADVFEQTKIDPWFLHQIQKLIDVSATFSSSPMGEGRDEVNSLNQLKRNGYSDRQIARLWSKSEDEIR